MPSDTVSPRTTPHIRRFESPTGTVHLGARDGADATACGRSAGLGDRYLETVGSLTCRRCQVAFVTACLDGTVRPEAVR